MGAMWTLRITLAIAAFSFSGSVLADTITVSRESCSRLTRHIPDASVAYQPGVDSQGRPVASADYGSTPALELPERFQIPITVDVAKRFGVPKRGDANYTGDIQVGLVEVDRRGRATFNGQPLSNEAEDELAQLCQAATATDSG